MITRNETLFSEWKKWIIFLLMFLVFAGIGFVSYEKVLSAPFLYDDIHLILENINIRELGNIWYFINYNRPLISFSYAVNFAVNGIQPSGYRLVHIFFHICNAFLVFLLVLSLLRFFRIGHGSSISRFPAGLTAGLLYLVNPALSMAVVLISARSSLMCTFFYLLGLLFFIRWEEKQGQGIGWLGIILAFLGAVMSKEIAITFPAACLLLLIIKDKHWWRGFLKREWKLFGLMMLGSMALLFHVFLFEYGVTVGGSALPFSRWEYLMTQGTVWLQYMKIFFLPLSAWLSVDRDYPIVRSFLDGRFLISSLILTVLFFSLIWLWRRGWSAVAFGGFFFFLCLMPTSSVVPIADLMMDYRLYLPAVGLVIVAGAIVFRVDGWIQCRPAVRKWVMTGLWIAILLWTGIYGAMLAQRLDVYQSPVALWKDTVKKSPNKARPRYNLANVLMAKYLFDEALVEAKKAMEIDPKNPKIFTAMGDIYREMNDTEMALDMYRKVLEINPNDHRVLCHVCYLLIKEGKYELARKNLSLFTTSMKTKEYLLTLALYLAETDQPQRAMTIYRQILWRYPAEKSAWLNVGNMHSKEGDFTEAEKCYRTALAIDSGYYLAEFGLGCLYLKQSNLSEALEHLLSARRLNPHFSTVDYELGNLFATLRNYAAAQEYYLQFLSKNSNNAQCWYRLGLVYLELGKLREAKDCFQKALTLEPDERIYKEALDGMRVEVYSASGSSRP